MDNGELFICCFDGQDTMTYLDKTHLKFQHSCALTQQRMAAALAATHSLQLQPCGCASVQPDSAPQHFCPVHRSSEGRWSYRGPLVSISNAYGDVQVTGAFPTDPDAFKLALSSIIDGAKRGVWMRMPFDSDHVKLIPLAHDLGFQNLHHAANGWLTLQAWRSEESTNVTPDFACTDIGAGAFVVNAKGQLLGIRERYDTTGRLHTPGGHVDAGEDVVSAGAREAREETGVSCVPLGVVGWRELILPMEPPPGTVLTSAEDLEKQIQNMRFGSSNIGCYVLCLATSDALAHDPDEVAEAAWFEPQEFVARAHDAEAVYARCMIDSGQLAMAARLARRLQGVPEGDHSMCEALPTPTSPSASEPSSLPYFTHAYQVRTSHRRWGDSGAYTAHWFNAFPPHIFTAAVRSVPSTLGLMSGGAVLPAEITARPEATKQPGGASFSTGTSHGRTDADKAQMLMRDLPLVSKVAAFIQDQPLASAFAVATLVLTAAAGGYFIGHGRQIQA